MFGPALDDEYAMDVDAEIAAEGEIAAENAQHQAASDDDEELVQAPRSRAGQAAETRRSRRIADDDEDDEDDEGDDEPMPAARGAGGAGPSGHAPQEAVDLFGEEENSGGGGEAGDVGGWGGLAGQIEQLDNQQQQQQAAAAHAGADDRDDGRSDAGLSDGGSAGDAPTYDGFDESILRHPEVSQPYLMPRDEQWKCIESLGPRDMRPKRAMRVIVPTEFFRRDAEFFRQWQLPKGCESRCRATAAIVSLLFAGTQMGFPSGMHEEKMRAQAQNDEQEQQQNAGGGRNAGKAKATPITKVTRYTYAPQDVQTDSYPMFQIGIEDIYNDDLSEIIALGVWLFIFDETHSTSALMKRVVQNTQSLKTAKQVSAASASSRSKDASTEADRHGKAGFGFHALRDNFEGTVGLQYQQIATMENWQQMLDLHSGRTSAGPGRPCVPDLAKHINCPAGRRQLEGDNKTGCGGKHPMAPEFALNAKRTDGLLFGTVHADGSPMDVCEDQVTVSTYWRGDGYFNVPQIGIPCFWMCTSVETRTIFELPLTRPLQGTVCPGTELMRLFLEMERRQKNAEAGHPERPIYQHQLRIDQNAMNRLRSLATSRDEHQRKQDSLLRNSLISYDLMTPAASAALSNGDVDYNPNATGEEANYTIRTVSMTKKVAIESDRIYTKVIAPWLSRMEKELSEIARPLQDDEVAPEDPRWNDYWKKRQTIDSRFYKVKRDLTQYHLRLLKTCFLSTKDSATLPAGYKAMFQGLEEGVRDHGGSASIAFNGGKHSSGRQLMNKDRQVWGSLQEWLRHVFVDCCKIKGRDRRIMDEMYLHMFEMYEDRLEV